MTKEEELLQRLGETAKLERAMVGNYEINYVTMGAGPTLLLIHGANIGWGQWYRVLPLLAQNFSVIAIDLPGAGGSTKFDYGQLQLEPDLVEPVEQFLQQLGVTNLTIVGHSIGGWLACQLALRGNISIVALVLAHSIGFSTTMPIQQHLLTFRPVAKLLASTLFSPTTRAMKIFLADGFYDSRYLEDILVDYYVESIHRSRLSHPVLFINALTRPFRFKPELIIRDQVATLTSPTLFIWGEHDRLFPVRHQMTQEQIPQAQVEVISQSGHVSFLENPIRFIDIIINFLRGHKVI